MIGVDFGMSFFGLELTVFREQLGYFMVAVKCNTVFKMC